MNSSTLRKAAILVSVLDTRSADALLDSMPPEQAAKVRAAVMNLEEIPAAEQELVIQEFLGQGKPAGDEVELELSPAAAAVAEEIAPLEAPKQATTPTSVPSQQAPFTFLNDADGETIAAVLKREQPQLTAAVLSHLSPARAADVLSHLPATLAGEVLVRIARLDEMSSDVLEDIEQQLRATLSPHLRTRPDSQPGFARLQAILTSTSPQQRDVMLGAVARKDQQLAGDLNRHTKQQPTESERRPAPASATAPAVKSTPRAPAAKPSIAFNDLFALDDAAWQKLLQSADQNVVLLAFAGAEPKLIDRILRGFPRREADAWRKEFSHPGPVRLRDLDAAQVALAQLACDLFQLQPLVPPRSQYAAVA